MGVAALHGPGSGTRIQDVNHVLKHLKQHKHRQMQKTMKKVTRKGAMKRMMRGLEAAQGGSGAERTTPALGSSRLWLARSTSLTRHD